MDYFFIRRQQLDVPELYSTKGRYSYGGGFNRLAVVALLLGILPNVPGFLATIKVVSTEAMPAWINDLYHYAWFVGFLVSGTIYLAMMRRPVRLMPSAVTTTS